MNRGTARLWLRPGLVGLHVFAVVAVAFCVFMGLWQLGVYDSRQEHEQADKREVPRVALSDVWGPDEAFTGELNHRPVAAKGTFAPTSEQVWVTGKKQRGQTGAWLLAPFLVEGGQRALLVVRGWAPSVTEFPAVPAGDVSIDAVLEQGEAGGAAYDPERREIGSVRIPALTNELPYDLYSGFAVSTSACGVRRARPRATAAAGRRVVDRGLAQPGVRVAVVGLRPVRAVHVVADVDRERGCCEAEGSLTW